MAGRPRAWLRRLARAVRRGGAAAGLAAWLAAPAAAQVPPGAPFAGLTVTAVHLEENGQEVTEPGLVGLVETLAGQPLSLVEVRDTIARLFGIGRFQNVLVDATRDGAGVALRYELVPLQSVVRVDFEGDLGLDAGRLRATLDDRFNGLPPVGRAPAAARALEDLYAGFGYTHATVTPAPPRQDPRGLVLVFDIDAGPRARLGTVAVVGTPRLPDAQLLDRLDVRPGGDYDRAALDRALARYVAELRGHGYYEAAARHETTVGPDGRTLDLTIDVESGPLVEVTFEGDRLPADREKELVPVQREGSVDEDLLEDSDRRIEQYLREQGYARARATHRRTQQDDRLDIVFTVHRGLQYRVDRVEITGNQAVPETDLRPLVRTDPGEPFVASRLGADVAAIEAYYRRQGYAEAKVVSEVPEPAPSASGPAAAFVTPRIVITEGPRTLVGGVDIEGNHAVPTADLAAAIQSKAGDPYTDRRALADRDAVTELYLDRGYLSASVQVAPRFDESHSSVDLVFTVSEGPQAIVDHIIVVGNTRTSTSTILRELPLEPGDPLGLSARIDSQRRLQALGLFRRVDISVLDHGGTRHDLLVTVEEAPTTTIGYGGGLEGGRRLRPSSTGGPPAERIDIAPRGFFEIGRRNLWGKNRSINLYSRLSVRQSDNVTDPSRSGHFNEYRVVSSYREPRAFGTNADLLVNGFLEQGVRTSFNFFRKGVTAELSKALRPRVRFSGRYSFGYTKVFDDRLTGGDQLLIDRLFPQVRLSALSGSLVRDTRDDAIDPAKGRLLSVDGEMAARAMGSQVGYVKTFLQGFMYRQLTPDRLILALGARLGLATGFPRDLVETDANGNPVLGANGQPVVKVSKDLPASERFFAGGDSTVRGFALDQLGRPDTIDSSGFPIGGNGLVVLNAELRSPQWHSLGVVGFVDAGSVFKRAGQINLGNLRSSVGFGLRYKSPIGPLRVDLGFKLNPQTLAKGGRERLTALHISFGQAF